MCKWLFIFLLGGPAVFSQHIIEGKIVDAETGQPVPFASVGVVGTTKGTSSNGEGQFTLPITAEVSLKITCVGYETVVVVVKNDLFLVRMKASTTELNQIVVFNKPVNAERVVRRAFAAIHDNYVTQPFLQQFFYRHYCKDDSVYGRLIEAFVDVWKHHGYGSAQSVAGFDEDLRVTQLRRSLDNTVMAQGHEAISVGNILQADIVGYQTAKRNPRLSFYDDVSDLQTDARDYAFVFKGVTAYDGQEVYEISYERKRDSVLTTSGHYLMLTRVHGSLFITTKTQAIVKSEDVKEYAGNVIRSSAYYRSDKGRYYPYHFIREGVNHHSDGTTHTFRIDLMSVDLKTTGFERFKGNEPDRESLLHITYDSVFWHNNAILKTTPLEDEIIRDLGNGSPLEKQFSLYKQYELNLRDGGINGATKFNWFLNDSKGKRVLYLFFWSGDCKPYLVDVEMAKRLQKKFHNQITFVFLSLDDDEAQWQQRVTKYNLTSDGIINYRIGSKAEILRDFNVENNPAFILLGKAGLKLSAKRPGDPEVESDFKIAVEAK